MKLVCERNLGGVTAVRVFTTAQNGNQGIYIRAIAGVGNPFWIWDSVPPGKVIGADFTDAPICSSDPAVNNQAIADIAANGPAPEDVLIYE